MGATIAAPWTEKQVERLRAFQASPLVHPFTCGRRSEPGHQIWDGDTGTLLPTRAGWVCRDCDYTQDWAYDFMFKPLPPDPFVALRPPVSSSQENPDG